MSRPRVSIVLIFFNEERFIAEAIDSVLAQDFDDYELLLVDDGSTDASSAIARNYARRYPNKIRYLEHEGHANRGASAARNLGLREGSAELFAFLDADDAWRPVKLREQVEILDLNPQAGMVCGMVNYWSSWEGGKDRLVPTGHVRDGISQPPRTSLALYPLGFADAPCPSDVMIRRSVFDRTGGFLEDFIGDLQLYEDQAFFSKAYLAAPVYFASRVWLDYRLHADSCVSRVVGKGLEAEVRSHFFEWFEHYLQSRGLPGEEGVAGALRKAKWRHEHPLLARVEHRCRRLAARLIGARRNEPSSAETAA